MGKNKKKDIISAKSAQAEDNIKTENNAEVSQPQAGDTKSFDAGSRDKEAEFDALIENEYKEQFSKKVQKIIRKRLREVKNLKEENMNKNNGKKEEILRRLAMENNLLKKRRDNESRMMKFRSDAQKLREQVEETKRVYPEFDFKKEMKNPEFVRLLKLGVNVKNAYEVVNIDTILENTTKAVERKIVDSIRLKGNRPVENGSEGSSGILLSGNASKLSKKERAELAKRAAKGERISL